MQTATRSGHCALPRHDLIGAAQDLLELKPERIAAELEAMIADGRIVRDLVMGQEVLYEPKLHACEKDVAKALAERIATVPMVSDDRLDAVIAAASGTVGITLNDGQRDAVRSALLQRSMVITGGPGTGKTTTIRTIVTALRQLHHDSTILLAAPTGRAAKRLSESTCHPAATLHRLLEWSPEGFQRHSDRPLVADLIVVDEASMIDVWMLRDLLRAVAPQTRLIFVGDADQLPSVGPGNVLGDMIGSGALPTVRLTEVRRHGEGSAIAQAAQQINAGRMPTASAPSRDNDMWGYYVDDAATVVDKVVKFAVEIMPKLGFDPLRDLQVLTPGHKCQTGTASLNKALQEALNPARDMDPRVRHRSREFRIGDRVIQVSNNYDLDVFNGDIGIVQSIDKSVDDETLIVVRFDDRDIAYNMNDLDQLQHAFAVTIHKSQGSEFPVVVVVLTTEHWVMLRRNLLYTGITRARRLCCLIGSQRAVSVAVRQDGARRITGLAQRLAGEVLALGC